MKLANIKKEIIKTGITECKLKYDRTLCCYNFEFKHIGFEGFAIKKTDDCVEVFLGVQTDCNKSYKLSNDTAIINEEQTHNKLVPIIKQILDKNNIKYAIYDSNNYDVTLYKLPVIQFDAKQLWD